MRTRILYASLTLLLVATGLNAQAGSVRLCVSEDAEGLDALKLARQLASRTLKNGSVPTVIAITAKALSPETEQKFAGSDTPFVHVVLAEETAKARAAEFHLDKCDYNIKISYHPLGGNVFLYESAPPPGGPGTLGAPPRPQENDPLHQPYHDPPRVAYELRKAGAKKVIVRGSAPPQTSRQGNVIFDPFPLLADQIVKKLDAIGPPSGNRN